jgi:PilZ domain-containing protein
LMNLSTRGAALFYSAPLAVGTVVRLRLTLRTGAETVSLKLAGVVRKSHLLGESHLIRVVFTNPPLEAVQAILEYIKTQCRGITGLHIASSRPGR